LGVGKWVLGVREEIFRKFPAFSAKREEFIEGKMQSCSLIAEN